MCRNANGCKSCTLGHRRVDFLILGKRLIFVEIDGGHHYQSERIRADRVRDKEIYPILGSDSLSLRLANRAIFDGTAEETLQQLFHYKERPFRGFVKSRLVSPIAGLFVLQTPKTHIFKRSWNSQTMSTDCEPTDHASRSISTHANRAWRLYERRSLRTILD